MFFFFFFFFLWFFVFFFFFFFQAEDGIRDVAVTGVQTCALPIWLGRYYLLAMFERHIGWAVACRPPSAETVNAPVSLRRRVGALVRPRSMPPTRDVLRHRHPPRHGLRRLRWTADSGRCRDQW